MPSMNETPKGERLHIGIFGLRNAGKSSVINALTKQELAIVSEIKGTTTDPVQKAMEILPIGPVVIIDTPGLDDVGELGEKRIEKAYQVLRKTDIALIVTDSADELTDAEKKIIDEIEKRGIKYIIVYNKIDILKARNCSDSEICVSAKTGEGIKELTERIAELAGKGAEEKYIAADLVEPGDTAVLVVPIDSAAPKGRLILPQQQTIRDLLERGAICTVCRDNELERTFESLAKRPKIVITDSQAFKKVSEVTPEDVWLTSFSILFARYKGELKTLVQGVSAIEGLCEGDRILISEGCTHHRQCEDIGTVKIPGWLCGYTGKKFNFEFTSGGEFPKDLSGYKAVIHCGGCMLNEKEMKYRITTAKNQGVPIVNYGILIAYLNGILKRSLQPFPEILSILDNLT